MQKIRLKAISLLLGVLVVLGIFFCLPITQINAAPAPKEYTLGGVTYKVYYDHAEISSVDPELTEIFIEAKIGDVSVNDYNPDFISGAVKLEKIGVSVDNPAFRSVDGVFMKYQVTKDENGNDIYKDTLCLYPPAGSSDYNLPATVEDIDINAFKYAPDVTVYVPNDHPKWTAVDSDVCEYTSEIIDGETHKTINAPKFKAEDYGVKFVQISGSEKDSQIVSAYGVIYEIYSGTDRAIIIGVDPEATEIYITADINGFRVGGFRHNFVEKAPNLAKINVSSDNRSFCSVDGIFAYYDIAKDKNGDDVYEYEILVYPPAGPKSYVLPLTVDYIDIDAFKSATGVKVGIPEDHPKWVVNNNVVMEYTTQTKTNADGTEEIVKVFRDTPKFVGDEYGVEFVTVYSGSNDLFMPPLKRGDVNCDNNVNTADIMTMLQIWKTNAVSNIFEYQAMIDTAANGTAYSTSQNAYQSIANADVYEEECRREINIFDITTLLSHYFGRTELPPTVLTYSN